MRKSAQAEKPLDRAAWGGITASNPFPPLPSNFGGPYLALRFRFYYNPEQARAGNPFTLAGTEGPQQLLGVRMRRYIPSSSIASIPGRTGAVTSRFMAICSAFVTVQRKVGKSARSEGMIAPDELP